MTDPTSSTGSSAAALVDDLRRSGVAGGDLVGLAVSSDGGRGSLMVAVASGSASAAWHVVADGERAVDVVRKIDADVRPRWVVWSGQTAFVLARAGVRLSTCWDVAAVHRLQAGGWRADPAAGVGARSRTGDRVIADAGTSRPVLVGRVRRRRGTSDSTGRSPATRVVGRRLDIHTRTADHVGAARLDGGAAPTPAGRRRGRQARRSRRSLGVDGRTVVCRTERRRPADGSRPGRGDHPVADRPATEQRC